MSARSEPNLVARLARHSDILLAVGVLMVLAIVIIPLPPVVMDVLLSLNVTTALVILMVSMYIREPLELSVFPGLLLIVTLFRLSLNIASTRLILSEAYAGEVILAFGTFVVRGNYVVGFVIFLILVIIQFVVITKGAGRIAEVAARFTLDAMPGKQMSIDADLNAGLIDDSEARQRREKISREADFYGAMDGASKFVRGDAIAGLLITTINIFGGLIIGVLQKGMSFSQALQTYTLLTVGDGLVSQIPALIISTAAGLVVTRAASESNLGQDLTGQLLAHPRALYVVAGVLLFFGLAPGLPAIPFFMLAAIAGVAARSAAQSQLAEAAEEAETAEAAAEPEGPEAVEQYLHVDPLELEIGYALIPLVDPSYGGDLLHRISMIRKQCAQEYGFVVPPIRIRDNIQLRSDEYVIKMRGTEVARGELKTGYVMALDPGNVERRIDGIETTDPAFGLSALWISERRKEEAERAGYTVVEPVAVLATHLKEVLMRHAEHLLGRQEVQNLIDQVKKDYPAVVEELIPGTLSLGAVQKVLQNLLKERVSIRDLVSILEALADYAPTSKDPDVLTEYVRNVLSHAVYRPYVAEDGRLYAIAVDPQVEKLIQDAVRQGDQAQGMPNLPADVLRRIYRQLKKYSDKMTTRGRQPVVVCSPLVRMYFRRLIAPAFVNMPVLSYTELPPQLEIQTEGVVRLEDEN